ncbi:MAG: hypothetical protein ACRDKT_02460 [Actinomycetota bacterium]
MAGVVDAGVVVLDEGATHAQTAIVLAAAEESIPGAHVVRGDTWTAIPVGDGTHPIDVVALEGFGGVERVASIAAPYRLAAREVFGRGMEVRLSDEVTVGGSGSIGLIVRSRWAMGSESRLSILAPLLRESGCNVFDAGRLAVNEHDPIPGIDEATLARVRAITKDAGLSLCIEISDADQIEVAERLADIVVVGSQNMHDFGLLRSMGRIDMPVILKRGGGATVEEFLLAAEYILMNGNGRVTLCESGIRTFDSARKTRFEINAVPLIKSCTHLPVLADPAVSTQHARFIPGVARAAVAAGADGLVLEVATEAADDRDGTSIDIVTLNALMTELKPIAKAVGRSMGHVPRHDGKDATDAAALLHITDRTLGLVIESRLGVAPQLEVVSQWRVSPPTPGWLSRSLAGGGDLSGRCTSYKIGGVRLSRNIAYVDLEQIDPTIAILLESRQLNLGQLFLDPRIVKRAFEFGTQDDAAEIDELLRANFPDEAPEPYVWRRYEGVIEGRVVFVVIESLPIATWERILGFGAGPLLQEEIA